MLAGASNVSSSRSGPAVQGPTGAGLLARVPPTGPCPCTAAAASCTASPCFVLCGGVQWRRRGLRVLNSVNAYEHRAAKTIQENKFNPTQLGPHKCCVPTMASQSHAAARLTDISTDEDLENSCPIFGLKDAPNLSLHDALAHAVAADPGSGAYTCAACWPAWQPHDAVWERLPGVVPVHFETASTFPKKKSPRCCCSSVCQ